MIDLIDDFYAGDTKEMVVGGIAGTEINQFVIDGATKNTPFNKVLFVQGCQDYIGLMKTPVPNVKHWTDLFVEEIVAPLIPFDPWKPRCLQEMPSFVNRLNESLIASYESLVIFDAHLVPYDVRRLLSEAFRGQIVSIIDPIENRSPRMERDMPMIVDTLRKLSPILAMARNAIGIETRAIDRKVRGSIVQTSKMNKRTIGKIDDKQYVTNDYELAYEVTKRQLETPFRKNQKVIVTDELIDMMNENGVRKASLGCESMLVIENATAKPLMKLRLYNSKITYYADLQYHDHTVPEALRQRGKIRVRPANILMMHDVPFHRFNHTVLVLTDDLNPGQKYTVLKNSNNVTVVDKPK